MSSPRIGRGATGTGATRNKFRAGADLVENVQKVDRDDYFWYTVAGYDGLRDAAEAFPEEERQAIAKTVVENVGQSRGGSKQRVIVVGVESQPQGRELTELLDSIETHVELAGGSSSHNR